MDETPSSSYRADHMEIGRSAVRQLTAASVSLDRSAVQQVVADSVHAKASLLGTVNGSTIEVDESMVGVAAADYVKIEDSRVFLLLAPRVSGNVHAIVTLPVAFMFGVGYFLARRIVSGLLGR
jgi:hypothetical protein